MPKVKLPVTNAAWVTLRTLKRLTQEEAGERTGRPSQVIEIENGRRKLPRPELDEMTGKIDVRPSSVPVALALAAEEMPGGEPDHPWEATPEDRLEVERAAVEASATVRKLLLAEARAARHAADRAEAGRLWELLKPHRPERRRVMARLQDFATWAMSERLCIESLREAPRNHRIARSLAELAVEIARRLPVRKGFSDRVEGYAQAHLGNALRVGNDFEEADRAFSSVAKLWPDPQSSDACPLDATLIPDLEASLRRAQRRFPLALDRIEQALALAVDDPTRGRILLKKADVLEHSGDPEGAVATLRIARPLVDLNADARLSCVARFNLAVNLLHLGLPSEAEPLIAEVRTMAIEQGNDLDLVRLGWLSGRLAAAKGNRASAIAAIEEAAFRFSERDMAFDVALAILDLAALLLEAGEAREAARRVAEVQPTFHVRNVQREELASLLLFLRAVEAEVATAALARAAAEAWRLFGV